MVRKIRKQEEEGATGWDAIAWNEDLLTLILLFLPVKSLLRFQSVSKNWLSIITSSRFIELKTKRSSKDISGFLLRHIYRYPNFNPRYHFIPLDDEDDNPSAAARMSPISRLDFVPAEGTIEVLEFCHGLLLCRDSVDFKHHIFNPTTKEYITPPDRVLDSGEMYPVLSMNLAFDPRKSSNYKLVCTYRNFCAAGVDFCIAIYSSETGDLRPIDASLNLLGPDYWRGLYWNGAVHWIIDYDNDGLYFNVDEERVGTFPSPPMSDGDEEGTSKFIRYFGESNDHLHLIISDSDVLSTEFDVYEMDKGYSGWFVKFRVDLQSVLSSFPESIVNHEDDPFGVLGVVRKDEDVKSFLVLSISRKVIRFHFEDGRFSKLCDFSSTNDHVYTWMQSIPFIGSLHRL